MRFKLIPYDALTLQTHLSAADIKSALQSVVEPSLLPKEYFKNFFYPYGSSHRRYRGWLSDDGFKIIKIIHYRNSFLPVITGSIKGSAIELVFRLHHVVSIFVVFWLSGVGVAAFIALTVFIVALQSGAHIPPQGLPAVLIPCGMFVFGCALTIFGFNLELRKEREFLTGLFKPGTTQ